MVSRPERDYATRTVQGGYAQTQSLEIDQGLRTFMQKVYSHMGIGLAITGLVAYFVGNNEAMLGAIYGTPLAWVVMFAPLGFSLLFSFRLHAMAGSTAQALFMVFAGLMGLSLSYIFAVYTEASIVKTFFVSSATFLSMSIYGYTTKRDLSGMGSFFMMGLIGLVLAMVVNLFLGSSALEFAISVIGVLLFTGLAAYDTQKVKEFYWEADGGEVATRKSILGAFVLYMDFINLFLFILRFLGDRR